MRKRRLSEQEEDAICRAIIFVRLRMEMFLMADIDPKEFKTEEFVDEAVIELKKSGCDKKRMRVLLLELGDRL